MLARRSIIIFFGFILAWQLFVVATHLPTFIFPTPILVAKTFWQNLSLLFSNAAITAVETLLGLGLGILFYIRVPSALPALASGLRMAAAIAPLGAVLGEWVGASSGLGFLMLNANARLDIALVFSALFLLIVFSLALYFLVDQFLKVIL